MNPASESEFDLHKKAISEIKLEISRFIGFIIGLTGLTGLIVKYVFRSTSDLPNSNSVDSLALLVSTLVLVTLIFEVIWYKFTSHNRHVGYLQLLSLELDHYELKKVLLEYRKDKGNIAIKPYLNDLQDSHKMAGFKLDHKAKLHSWDFVMARYRTAKFKGALDDIIDSMDKAVFVFKLSRGKTYQECFELPENYIRLDHDFFKDVVGPLFSQDDYKEDEPKPWFKVIEKLLRQIYHQILSLPSLYFEILSEHLMHISTTIDKRYISKGWGYPKVVLKICLIPVIMLSGAFFYVLKRDYYFDISALNLETILVWIVVVVLLIWCRRYIYNLGRLVYGQGSIQYYRWTFFTFRVQFLNNNDVLPVYFSQSFMRYFRHRFYAFRIKSKWKTQEIEEFICSVCFTNSTFTYDAVSKKKSSKKVCKSCIDQYVKALEDCRPVKNPKLLVKKLKDQKHKRLKDVHDWLKPILREDLDSHDNII